MINPAIAGNDDFIPPCAWCGKLTEPGEEYWFDTRHSETWCSACCALSWLDTYPETVKAEMSKDEKLKLCKGCRDDYYNRTGNSAEGKCWMLKSAKPVTRTLVGYWQDPPYKWEPQETLSCHHPEGFVWINRDDVRIKEPVLEETK